MFVGDEVAIAGRLIETGRYMSLATLDGSRPWVAAVAYVHTAGHVFCWASRRDARHSLDIAATGQAAATIFDSQASYEKVEGIQFAGEAEAVPDHELPDLLALYVRRFPMYEALDPADLASSGTFGLYRLRVTELWTLAPASAEGDQRVPVDLTRL